MDKTKYNFKSFTYSHIDKINNKKIYVDLPCWKKNREDILKNQEKYNKANHKAQSYYTGEINNIVVVDFDKLDNESVGECASFDTFMDKYPEFNTNFMVKTHRGYHVYFPYKGNERFKCGQSNDIVGIDIRSNGSMIVGVGSYRKDTNSHYTIFNDGNIEGIIPDEIYNYYNWTKTKKIKKLVKNEEPEPEPETIELLNLIECDKYHRSIMNNINLDKYASSYNDWCKFIWAIKMTFKNSLKIADEYSQKIREYINIDDVKSYMDKATENRIGFGYLMKLSQLSNKSNHCLIIREKHSFLECDDTSLAHVAIELLQDEIIKITNGDNDTFYIYENPYWKEATEDILQKWVRTALSNYYEYLIKSICIDHDAPEDIVESLTKKRTLYNSSYWL